MPVPMLRAAEERPQHVDVSETIRCALVSKPRQQNEFLRYVLVASAWLAVGLLVAIAVYYTLLR